MELITPDPGLFLWTVILFLALFFLLRRFAWKPILNALHEREESIASSLAEAENAKAEMAKLQSDNESLLREARAEREKIMQEASKARDEMIKKAKDEAAAAGAKEREKARLQIESEKNAALNEIKNTAATLAVEIAEKILRKEFEDKDTQKAYASELINDLTDN